MADEETSLLQARRRSSVVKIQEEEQFQVPGWFNFTVQVMEYAPLWCLLFIDNATTALTAAFFVTCCQLALSYFQFKSGRISVYPKPLDIVFTSIFGLLAISSWVFMDNADKIEKYLGAFVNSSLGLGMFFSLIVGHPVARGYQVDNVGEAKASHPVFVHMAARTSVMLGCAFSFAGIASALYPESEDAFLITNLVIGAAMLTAYQLYPAHVFGNVEEFAAMYDDEIAEWEEKHPDVDFEQN